VTMGFFFDYTGGFHASLYFLTAVAILTGMGAVRLKGLAR